MKRAIIFAAAVLAAGCAAAVTGALAARSEPSASYGLANAHADASAGIDSANARALKRAWRIQTPAPVSGAPLVANGRIYFADWGGSAYAADARGRVVWRTKLEKPNANWPWHGFAGGGALGGGSLYFASAEGWMFALDPSSGAVRWKTRITDQEGGGNIARVLYDAGLVYVGLSSVNEPQSKKKPKGWTPPFRGHVLAVNASTGKIVWDRQLVQAPHNGVAVWGGFSLDPAHHLLFTATGNNYTGTSTPLSDSMLALDSRTGRIVWSHQTYQHDVWTPAKPAGPDWDYGAAPQLFTAKINGTLRLLVGAGNKGGDYTVFDSQTGQPVWHTIVGYGSVGGGIRWAASTGLGRIFISSNNNYGDKRPEHFPQNVEALDAATGKVIWAQPKIQPANAAAAGFLSDDTYLVPSADGTVIAYRATDGKPIKMIRAAGPISSSLLVRGNALVFGTGVPPAFGGSKSGMGLSVWTVEGATPAP